LPGEVANLADKCSSVRAERALQMGLVLEVVPSGRHAASVMHPADGMPDDLLRVSVGLEDPN